MNSSRGIYRWFAGALSATAIVASVGVGAQSAAADGDTQINLTPATTDVIYGQAWGMTATISGSFYYWSQDALARVHVSGTEDPYSLVTLYSTDAHNAHGYVSSSYDREPLAAGTYTVTASVDATQYGNRFAGESAPVTLTIAPAALATDVRMLADPSNTENAVITASLSGDFLSLIDPGLTAAGAAVLPAGSWHVSVDAADGATVLDQTIEQERGAGPAVTVYWTGAEAGAGYTANASFTPSAEAADNFTIAAATPFPYTAAAVQRPVPTSPADPPPSDPAAVAGQASVPVWAFVAGGVLALGLIAAIIVLSVRLRSPRRPRLPIVAEATHVA
ncbi:MAG: hypothetical protein ABWX82_07055 [Leifsonia sp.]